MRHRRHPMSARARPLAAMRYTRFLPCTLRVLLLITVACRGSVESSGGGVTDDAMSKGDSGTGGTGAPSGSCADPIVVSLGTTVRGTTCGGTHFGDSICQARLNPDVFLYVDAAAGTALRLDSSYGVSLMAFWS